MMGILGVRTWRMERGISLESIADATKLSLRILNAIEAGDFKRLPGGIYNTNYLKQYAKAIGFAEVELLEYYRDVMSGSAKPAVKESVPASPRMFGPLFQNS